MALNNHDEQQQPLETERKLPKWITMKEDIVISGISGIFPDSFDMNEFAKNLFDGRNCVTGSYPRWPPGYLGLPKLLGTVPSDLTTFDADFFDYKDEHEINALDFQLRFLLEKCQEAFLDAGIDPETWRGTNTGYFLASSVDETNLFSQDLSREKGALQLHAARIPTYFDFHGPVSNVDVACGSSLTALHQAMVALRTGECNAAIVAAANICVYPGTAMMFHDMSMTSQECKCKAFDASADGYARAEALGVLLLQKKKDAKRIYATVRHSKSNADGYKQEGITFPKASTQTQLIKETYREVGINRLKVQYMESHATGTKAGDPVECKAMADAMYETEDGRRTEPIWVGALKSNIGHTEAASGLAAIAKVIISYENKCIPKNIHINILNPDIPELHDGRLKPLTENTPFEGGLVSVNNFGFGGANAHAILESYVNEPSEESYRIADPIPRLVLMCGRTDNALNHLFDWIQENRPKVNRGFLALINEISRQNRNKMPIRGAMILHKDAENESGIQMEETSAERRPLYYLFTGMGSQWPAMAKSLMRCNMFADSIRHLSRVLQPYGIDLVQLLTSSEAAPLSRPVGCFVSIAAIQIALVDLLRNLGLTPDGYLGHSIGEMGCAYADEALTAEQTILAAYWRGKCTEASITERGLMVAVGMTWEEIKGKCPSGIFAACNNSNDSVTIAGPYQQTLTFLKKLRDQNHFVKEVDSVGIPFHSPDMSKIRPSLTGALNSINIKPKQRSHKWLSTSAEDNSMSDVSYYINNLIKPVEFFEAAKRIPKNAVVIELSAHSLFNSAIKGTVGKGVEFIPAMRKNGTIDNLLEAIGQLYVHGYEPLIEKLYPSVKWPVPRSTPFISPLIRWNHSKSYYVPDYENYCIKEEKMKKVFKVKLRDREHEALAGHILEGRTLFPATAYLLLAWKTLATNLSVKYQELPVQFENVQLKSATIMNKDREVSFECHYFEANGDFEITESGQVCVSGRITTPQTTDDSFLKFGYLLDEALNKDESNEIILKSVDVYKELRLRGYDYGPTFQGIQSATKDGRHGTVKWTGDWIAFADAMLQIGILSKEGRVHRLPTTIELLRCDPRMMNLASEERIVDVAYDKKTDIACAVGIELRGLLTTSTARRQQTDVTLEKYLFIPHNEQCAIDEYTKADIEEYIAACQSVAYHIQKTFGESPKKPSNPHIDVQKFLSQDSSKYTIIKILNEIRINVKSKAGYYEIIEQLIEANRKELRDDIILNSQLFCDRFVQPLIDTTIDNSYSNPFCILEVNFGGNPLESYLSQILSLQPISTRFELTIAHTDKQDVESEVNDSIIIDLDGNNFRLGETADNIKDQSQGLIVLRDVTTCSIGKPVPDLRQGIENLNYALQETGFFLAFIKYKSLPFEELLTSEKIDHKKRCDDFIARAQQLGYILINRKYDSLHTMAILLRKQSTKPKPNLLIIEVKNDDFNWVEEYKLAQMRLKDNEKIWLLANEKYSGVIGVMNCLRKEPSGNHVRFVFDQRLRGKKIPEEVLEMDLQHNVFRDGVWGQMRYLLLDKHSIKLRETEDAYVNVQNKGDLSSFAWFESPHKFWPLNRKKNETLVEVYYAPLNFRDVMCASGRLSADAIPGGLNIEDGILGLEFAGIDENGNRVMGMVAGRGLATTVVVPDPDFLWSIPENWSMEEAATVPCVYSTSYYGLIIRAKLQPGEKVLIHAGSGGVGLSAIAICLSMDCEVFTTVGTVEKVAFLKELFPQLLDSHIFNSRDTKFESQIMRITDGQGVDVILNSLSEDKLLATVRCLAPNGRFCEIGKFDLSVNNPLDLSNLVQNKTFHGVLLDAFFDFEKIPQILCEQKKLLGKLLIEGIKSGVVKPLPRTLFKREEVEEAFRYMSTGKHMGKIVLQIRNENEPQSKLKVPAIPRTVINPQKSIIITGGLGGFGLELAQWLAERGAKKLVLTSRNGPQNPYQFHAIDRLNKMGVNLKIWKGMGLNETEVKECIKTASDMGAVGAIFHLAMVMLDSLMENQTVENFERSATTKIKQCLLFDQISRKMCPQLDYFVAFSSIVAGRGNAGQANYGFGNSSCERIIECRHIEGLPGLAIQFGAIGDVGFVAEQMKTDTIAGTVIQRIPSCMIVLDKFLQTDYPILASRVRADNDRKSTANSLNLMAQIGHILGVNDSTKLDHKSRLVDLGMDSLMGIEIKLALERDYNTNLSTQEIRNLTIGDLAHFQAVAPKQTSNQVEAEETPIDVVLVPTDPTIHLNHVQIGKPIFVLPSAEDQFHSMKQLATKIMRPVIGLNWTEEFTKMPSIQIVAAKWLRVLENIEKNTDGNIDIDLIGHSFGGVVALEMAIQLQKRGRRVKNFVIIESSPKLMKEFCRELFGGSEEELTSHASALASFITNIADIGDEAKPELMACYDSEDRYKCAVKKLKEAAINIPDTKLLSALQAFITKANLLYKYVNDLKYNGDVTLIRANKSDSIIDNDYGLSEVVSGQIDLNLYEGDRKHFIKNNLEDIATLINRLK